MFEGGALALQLVAADILMKLGVSSRTEAAAVAHRLRLFDDEG